MKSGRNEAQESGVVAVSCQIVETGLFSPLFPLLLTQQNGCSFDHDLEDWLGLHSGSPLYLASPNVELGAMPGTGDDVLFQSALG